MKRFLAIFLAVVLCFTAMLSLAACNGNNNDDATPVLADAVEYLKAAYKSDEGKETVNDYYMPAQVVLDGVTFTVTYTVDNAAIKVVYDETKKLYKVDLPDVNDTKADYKLTATVTDSASATEKIEFKRVLPVIEKVSGVVTAPEANTAYKLFMDQKSVAQVLFITAEADGTQFLKTNKDPKAAPDFFVEVVEGGYKIYTMVNNVKMYMYATAAPRAGAEGKFDKAIALSADNASVFFHKETINAWCVTINTTPDADVATPLDFAVGTYGTYKTLCLSEDSHYTPENTGVEQFPLEFITKEAGEAMTPSVDIPDPTTVTPIAEVLTIALAKEHDKYTVEKYMIEGVITEIKNPTYGNLYVKDSAGNSIYVYGFYDITGKVRYDALETKPQVGDTVKIMGIVGQYSGTAQMKNAQLVSMTAKEWTNAEKVAAVKEALTIAEIKASGVINLPLSNATHAGVVISWALASDNTADVTLDATTGELTVTLKDAAQTVKLVATITAGTGDNAATDTKTIEVNVIKKPTIVPVKVEAPVVGTGYKLALNQPTVNKFLYFAGTTKNNANEFLNSTEDYTASPDVFVEEVTAGSGNFRLYFMNGTTKTYIEIYIKEGTTSKRLRLVTEPTTVWTWDADLGIYVSDVNPAAETTENYYIGTYEDFETLSPSGTYRISGDNAAAAGVTQFVAYFYQMVDTNSISDADKVAAEKGNLNFNVTEVTEAEKSITLPSTPVSHNDVTITWAVTEGGTVATITDGKLVVTLPAVDTADVVVKLTATIAIGTTSETKEFTFTVKAPTSAVILNTAIPYNFYLYSAQLEKNLYFAGTTVSGKNYQLATTDNAAKAVQVYLETVTDVEGGYRVFFYDAANSNTKTYIKVTSYGSSGGGTIALVTEAPTEYFTYSKQFNTLVYKYDNNTIYLGAYNDKDFIQASNTSFITGDNASKVGVSQYVAVFSAAPIVGVEYDLGMYNATLEKNVYFTGAKNGNYFATKAAKDFAAVVHVEAVDGVEGAFRLFFYDKANSDTKTYLRTYEYQDNKGGVEFSTTVPAEYYTFSNELGAIVCTIDENTYYLGSYDANTYIRTSNISYITGDNASKVGKTQYLATLTAHDPDFVSPDADQIAYEKGNVTVKSSVATETTINLPAVGVDFAGVTITWTAEGATVADGKVTITPATTETTVTLTATFTKGEATDTKTFTITVAAATGNTYVAGAPVEGQAYVFVAKNGDDYYLTGHASKKPTTGTDASAAKEMFVEYVKSGDTVIGYHIYYMNGTTKNYIGYGTSGTDFSMSSGSAPTTGYWAYDTDNAAWRWTTDGTTLGRFIGLAANKDKVGAYAENNISDTTTYAHFDFEIKA